MRTPPAGSLLFSLCLLAVPVYFIVKAMDYSPQARTVPLVIAIPTLLLQLVVILGHHFPRLVRGFDVDIVWLASKTAAPPRGRSGEAGGAGSGAPNELRAVLNMVVWMSGLFISVVLVGFIPTLLGFAVLFLLASGQARWWAALLVGAGFTAAVWVVFVKGMRFKLFEGVLFGGVLPLL